MNDAATKVDKENILSIKKNDRIQLDGDIGDYEQEQENLEQKLSNLNTEIRTKDNERSRLEIELSTAENSLASKISLVQEKQAEVDDILRKDGGLFKWSDDEDGLVLRSERIEKYKTALADLVNARQLVTTGEIEISRLTERIANLSNYISDLNSEKGRSETRLGKIIPKITLFKSTRAQISTDIENIESELTSIRSNIQARSFDFNTGLSNIQQQFIEIDFELSEQENIGDKLIGLGLIISEQDITFWRDYIYDPQKPEELASGLFKSETENGDENIHELNQPLEMLRSFIDSQNSSEAEVDAFLDNFTQVLANQKEEIQEWLNQDHPNLVNGFDQKLEQGEAAQNDIQLGIRLRSLIEQGNLKDVIEAVTDQIRITEFTNLVTGGVASREDILKLKEIVQQEVLDDLGDQKDILQDVNDANLIIQEGLESLDETAQKLFQAFEQKLPKALGQYLNAQDSLDLQQDIQEIVSARLKVISDSVHAVDDTITAFSDKIAAQKSLSEKITAIDRELQLSDQAFALADTKELLNKAGLSTKSLETGIEQLSDLIQTLIDTGNLDSVTQQKLEASKQQIISLPELNVLLGDFESLSSDLEAQFLGLTTQEVDLLKIAVDYAARSNEKSDLEDHLKRKNAKDKGVDSKSLDDDLDALISGIEQPSNLENRYFITPEADTWENLQKFAESVGGNLVTINGLNEQKFLKRIFTRDQSSRVIKDADFWIGLNDVEKEGKWRWADGQVDDYRNWADSNNTKHRDYVFMNQQGVWKTANGEKKLRGLVELDFNKITIERLKIQTLLTDELEVLESNISDNADYKTLSTAINTITEAFEQAKENAGIPELTIVDLLTSIRDKYANSQNNLSEIEQEIKRRTQSAEALNNTADFYKQAATRYLSEHEALKKEFAQKYGLEITDSKTWTETRKTWTRSLFGKKEVDVEITHVNTHWLYYKQFSKQAERARAQANDVLGEDITNETKTITELSSQKNTAQTIADAWEAANSEANVLEGYIEELKTVIQRIKVGDQQTPEYQAAVDEFNNLLPSLESELGKAEILTKTAYQNVQNQWQQFDNRAEELQAVYDEVIPLKAEYRKQNLAILSDIQTTIDWVELKNQSLEVLLDSVTTVKTKLEDYLFGPTLQVIPGPGFPIPPKPPIETVPYFKDTLEYLSDNETILLDRLTALDEHGEALDAQQDVLLKELELIDAYFNNGGKEFAVLRLQLDQAKSNLREVQSLAEIAVDSSTVLTGDLNRLTAYLSNLNDERLAAVQESITAIQNLTKNINNRQNLFGQAQEKLDSMNDLQPELIELLKKMKAAGETRAENLLETAENRGLAVAATIYHQDFSDLLTDTGNFLNGGVATEADRKLARRFLKELRLYRSIKREAEEEADLADSALKLAQGQKDLIDAEVSNAQIEYDDYLAQIGDLEAASDAEREKLYELQARQQTLANLQGPTLEIINSLISVQGLNRELASLEVTYAEELALDLSITARQQYHLDALAKNYERQQILTEIEVLGKQDAYATLQDSLIEIGRDYGLGINPILETTNHTQEIISLQQQLQTLELSPRLPDDIKAELDIILSEIDRALEGKSVQEIDSQLTSITEHLSEEIDRFKLDLDELNHEFDKDQKLLQSAETNLKTAVDTLLSAIEDRNDYIEDQSILTDEVLGVLEEVRLADDANSLSLDLAKQARGILEDVLTQRQIERDARQISVFDFITDSVSTIIAIAGTVITAGTSAGLLATNGAIVEGLRAGLAVAAKVNAAVSAASKGDWSGALFNAVGATVTYFDNLGVFLEKYEKFKLDEFIGFDVKELTDLLEKSYKTLKTAQSGESLDAFLQGVDAFGGIILKGIDKISDDISLSDKFIKNFKKLPGLLQNSVDSIESGNWLDASSNIFQTVTTLASMRAIEDKDSARFASRVNFAELVGNVSLDITDAIINADVKGWFETIDQSLQRHQFFKTTQININKAYLKTLSFKPIKQATLENGKNIEFLALHGEIDPSKPTYVITAGYLTGSASDLLANTALLLQDRVGDANFILVEWSEATGHGFTPLSDALYIGAAKNAVQVGESLGNFLSEQGVNPDTLHLIGHSLGAHVSGIAGRQLFEQTGKKALEIVGLDPAGPGFSENQRVLGQSINESGNLNKLDPSDAQNVITVSSNSTNDGVLNTITGFFGAGHFGIDENLGHVNIHLDKNANNYYPSISHGDAINFLQQFLTLPQFKGNVTKNLDQFHKEQADKISKKISPPFDAVKEEIERVRQAFIIKNQLNLSEPIPYKEPFELKIQNNLGGKQVKTTSTNFSFNITQDDNSFELRPTNYHPEQFLEIVDFDTTSLRLETSYDNGLTWDLVNPFDFNSKLQFFDGDRRYRITPLQEGEFDIQLRGLGLGELPSAPAKIISGTDDDDIISGGADNDYIKGLAGNDRLNGLKGDDTLEGGVGNDIYYIDSSGDQVIEAVNEGTDSVYAYTDDLSLTENVENLYLINQSLTSGIGNELNNYIRGNNADNHLKGLEGKDRLNGLKGDDTLEGGVGNDIYYIDSSGDQVIEAVNEGTDSVYAYTDDLSLTENVENLYLINQSLTSGTGNELNNYIRGNNADNHLKGLEGKDRLNGLKGDDTLEGGVGNDIYYIDSSGDQVIEAVNEGTDSVYAYTDDLSLTENVENLYLINQSLTSGTGNELNNYIRGNNADNHLKGLEGKDRLNGLKGDDTLEGGVGNDIYYIDSSGDQVIEAVNEGTDSVYAYTDDLSLTENVENLYLINQSLTSGTGNELNNYLRGNNNDNILMGLEGNDRLNGLSGNDTLEGGKHADKLIGGSGADTFLYQTLSDSLLQRYDKIRDLDIGVDHIVVLNGVSADNIIHMGDLLSLQATALERDLTAINASGAATFQYRNRSFLVLNDNQQGFQSNVDGFIEISGFKGDLMQLEIQSIDR